MERLRCQEIKVNPFIEELRCSVQNLVNENIAEPNGYECLGRQIREGVAAFINEHKEYLPEKLPIIPNLTLYTETAELKRQGQDVNLDQAELHEVWFRTSGLIINAIERRYGR